MLIIPANSPLRGASLAVALACVPDTDQPCAVVWRHLVEPNALVALPGCKFIPAINVLTKGAAQPSGNVEHTPHSKKSLGAGLHVSDILANPEMYLAAHSILSSNPESWGVPSIQVNKQKLVKPSCSRVPPDRRNVTKIISDGVNVLQQQDLHSDNWPGGTLDRFTYGPGITRENGMVIAGRYVGGPLHRDLVRFLLTDAFGLILLGVKIFFAIDFNQPGVLVWLAELATAGSVFATNILSDPTLMGDWSTKFPQYGQVSHDPTTMSSATAAITFAQFLRLDNCVGPGTAVFTMLRPGDMYCIKRNALHLFRNQPSIDGIPGFTLSIAADVLFPCFDSPSLAQDQRGRLLDYANQEPACSQSPFQYLFTPVAFDLSLSTLAETPVTICRRLAGLSIPAPETTSARFIVGQCEDAAMGRGLFAASRVREGDFLFEFTGVLRYVVLHERETTSEAVGLVNSKHPHVWPIDAQQLWSGARSDRARWGLVIDATSSGNEGRFVNATWHGGPDDQPPVRDPFAATALAIVFDDDKGYPRLFFRACKDMVAGCEVYARMYHGNAPISYRCNNTRWPDVSPAEYVPGGVLPAYSSL